jgi:hypothetical protein
MLALFYLTCGSIRSSTPEVFEPQVRGTLIKPLSVRKVTKIIHKKQLLEPFVGFMHITMTVNDPMTLITTSYFSYFFSLPTCMLPLSPLDPKRSRTDHKIPKINLKSAPDGLRKKYVNFHFFH